MSESITKAQVFDISIAANSIADSDGIIIEVNPAFLETWGFSNRDEAVGKHITYFFQNYDRAVEVITALNTIGVWEGDFIANKHDGSTFVGHSVATVLRDKDNKIIGYQSSVIDVSKRQAIEDQLRVSEEKYFSIFKNAPRLITLVYEDGTLKDCNDRIDILGYTKDEVVGKNISIFFSELSKKTAVDTLEYLFANTDKNSDKEFVMIKKTGEEIDVSIKSAISIDEEGDKHTLCFIADITKHKNAERRLIKAAHDLKSSNEELEQFAYIASHDLQEPLRAVSSYCQLLKEKEYEDVDEESKKFFNYIIDSSFRMKTLIRELLDYSRVGRRDKPFERINLKNLLEEVLSDFDMLIEDSKAEIIIESSMPNIFAIRFRIKQLLHNLVSNSLKFRGEDNPIIRIGCCEENENSHYWLFYVKDNGIGIDSKYYERVFGVFKRLYSREEYPGTGIGLALCKRIAEAHGGDIWVESEVGKGTYIYFTIAKSWAIFED
jgi:PAS domain S-box-containing protein